MFILNVVRLNIIHLNTASFFLLFLLLLLLLLLFGAKPRPKAHFGCFRLQLGLPTRPCMAFPFCASKHASCMHAKAALSPLSNNTFTLSLVSFAVPNPFSVYFTLRLHQWSMLSMVDEVQKCCKQTRWSLSLTCHKLRNLRHLQQ